MSDKGKFKGKVIHWRVRKGYGKMELRYTCNSTRAYARHYEEVSSQAKARATYRPGILFLTLT